MAEHGKPEKDLETIRGKTAVAASKEEAASTASLMAGISNHPETSQDVRALATYYRRELEAPPTATDTARREQLMAAATAFASRVS